MKLKGVECLLFPFLYKTPHCTPTICGSCFAAEGEGDGSENGAFAAAIMPNHKVHERSKFDLQKFVALLRVLALRTKIGLGGGANHKIFANNTQNDTSFRWHLECEISKVPRIRPANLVHFGLLETSSS